MISADPQPDQKPELWDDHVSVYENVFEPFTMQFARAAIDALSLAPGQRVLDVGAGCGGAALEMASRGAKVTAIDASPKMVERILVKAVEGRRSIEAQVMDGQALEFADACFDAALSVLGVILFPDAARGLAEMRRVVCPGGLVSVVTWTEPERYELAALLREAMQSVWPDQPLAPLPAQLRYRKEDDFRALFRAAGLAEPAIAKVTAHLEAPSTRWLAENMAFAPGMAAMLAGLGDRRSAVLEEFVERLGRGAIRLAGLAFIGTAPVA